MTFGRLTELLSEQATKAGLLLLFGNEDSLNIQVNAVSGMFMTFDVPDGVMNSLPPATRKYNVVLQCLDGSTYEVDRSNELDVLIRTDLMISRILQAFVCVAGIEGLRVQKVQNIYDSKKSGWRASFTITDESVNYYG